MIDYYEILQLSPDASDEAVTEQYQYLCDSLQPVAAAGSEAGEYLERAEAESRLLDEAYAILHNSRRRHTYDRERDAAIAAAKESLSAPPKELPPEKLTLLRPASPSSEAPSATTRSPLRGGALDIRLVAAFLAGALIAGGVLAVKYRSLGLQDGQSVVARLLSIALHADTAKELAYQQNPERRLAHSQVASPAPEMGALSNRVAAKGAVPAKLARPSAGESDAADGQIGAGRKEPPVSVEIILAKGQQTFGVQHVGNVEVVYPDGLQDPWTTKGNCAQAHIAADGTVGWTVYQPTKSGNYDFQPNGLLVLRSRGQTIRKISIGSGYIDDWNFLDRGSKVILRGRRLAGGAVIERHESATGRLLDNVDAARGELPLGR